MATFLDGLHLVEKNTFLEVVEKEPQGKVMRSMSWHDGDSNGTRSSDETETATSASDGGSHSLLSTSIETYETHEIGEIREIKQVEQAEQVEQVEQVYIPSDLAPSASAIPSIVDPMQGAMRGIGGAPGHHAHAKKACKPCVFAASRTGCASTICEFCHDHHFSCGGRRPRKETRERFKEAVASVFARQMDFNDRCQILQAMAQQSPYMRGIIVGRLDQE